MFRAFACSLALLVLPLAAASAQTLKKEDAEKMVIGLYAVSVAVDTCDLDMTKEQETRLEFWIDWAEQQLNIADRKLDKAYAEMEKEAEKNKKDFCEKMMPIATQALKELPPAM
ncbi:hypothetical protein [Reyranella sp.]|jgi:hypothetical protein|uniref:hypothetical protein n=1 Tax=Reyranella sp. TaxID=1929291 RepID=UPI00271A5085|nr:hypothetical protein [Reyranella sp.]MDO8977279.1 hypothetical protein [Reyranella sp.]MDP3241641.1 hypothetical protein [Reyranella sp.]